MKIKGWRVMHITWPNRRIFRGLNSRDIVVVTHHAPMTKRASSASSLQFADSPVTSAFGTDLLVGKRLKKGEWEGVKS
ncbi:hypothetical protein BDV12DRAFT_20474 [Aspergillus spectabilis]